MAGGGGCTAQAQAIDHPLHCFAAGDMCGAVISIPPLQGIKMTAVAEQSRIWDPNLYAVCFVTKL